MGTSHAARTASEERLERAIDRAFGVVSTGMVTEVLDVSPATLRSRARRGQLVRLSHGVYAHPEALLAGLTELMALTLWPTPSIPGQALVVGETALYLRLAWDWDDELCDTLAFVPIELAFPPWYRTHRSPPRRYDPTSTEPVRLRPDLYPSTHAALKRTTGMFHRLFRVQHVGPALRSCLTSPHYDKMRLAGWILGTRALEALVGGNEEAIRRQTESLAARTSRGLKNAREAVQLLRALADALPDTSPGTRSESVTVCQNSPPQDGMSR